MIVLRFGRWSYEATSSYTYDRIYWQGWRWTPFCRRRIRIRNIGI